MIRFLYSGCGAILFTSTATVCSLFVFTTVPCSFLEARTSSAAGAAACTEGAGQQNAEEEVSQKEREAASWADEGALKGVNNEAIAPAPFHPLH